MFDKFSSRTFIRCALTIETALSIGSRLSLQPTGTDLPVMKGPDGSPFIPGSSIKGVIRFQTERLLRGWNHKPDLWACDPFASPCVTDKDREDLWDDSKGEDATFSQKVWDASCTACRLFGSPWFAGRVAIKDAYLIDTQHLVSVTQIRDGVGIDRDLGAARAQIKYDFEVVIPGTRFGIEMVAENLEDWELGLLLIVLRLWEEGEVALGGKSTRGLGWGKLAEIRLERVDQDTLLDYLTQGVKKTVEPATFLAAFRSKLGQGR
ncbi:MAG TPA: CRISPR-associated RAMP protein Csx7 [Dehalococcoidia bacterium]|nr:CRISPR-associated RAMP protein Csx7 [Dehalococcoidia bacterium]